MSTLSPEKIVKKMLKKDQFSEYLGLKIDTIQEGKVALSTIVKKSMLNGFGIAHGGISYSVADSCAAFVANTYGTKHYSIETSISHLGKINKGDFVSALGTCIKAGNSIKTIEVSIFANDQLVAHFKSSNYNTRKEWK